MGANPRQFHPFLVENKCIKSSNEVIHLGISIDEKVTFAKHVKNLSNVASNHLRALTRIRKFLSRGQAKLSFSKA